MVHVQHHNCGSADVGQPSYNYIYEAKMHIPLIDSWIKQAGEAPGLRIEARKVGPFVLVAPTATKRQIHEFSLSAMLARDDMINGEFKPRY
jgi:hypothetical protein